MRRFFGSWYEVDGNRQAGYFLGYALVCVGATTQSLQEILCLSLSEIEARVRQALREMAA